MPLLSVLWGMALLSLLTVTLLTSSGTSWKLAHNAVEAAQIEAVAEAAIVRAAVALSDPRPERRWHVDGRPEHFELHGIEATVFVQDELGRIDLNYADRSLLFGLLQSVGIAPQLANNLTDAIADWRMANSPEKGADKTSDAASTDRIEPRHGLFQSVDELRLVQGMTSAIFRQVAPALTVYSQRPSIDPQLAPKEALLALPGMTRDRAAELVSQRERAPQDFNSVLPVLKGRAYTIRIDINGAGRARRFQAAIRFTDEPGRLYWLLDWRDQADPSATKASRNYFDG
jgi:general secretion pathway protein K